MSRPKYIASCSGGKDSVATFCWLHSTMNRWMKPCSVRSCSTKTQAVKSRNTGTSSMTGSSPSVKRSWASSSPFHADKTYDDVSIMSSPADRIRARFAASHGLGCVQSSRDCKIPPVRKYNAALSSDTVSYVGIAQDEPKRLARLDGVKKVSLLGKYGMTEADATSSVRNTGCFPRSTVTAGETAAGSVPMPVTRSCCTWSQSTRICLTG